MRTLELQGPQVRLFLPDPVKAGSALDYFESNKDHLHATDPALPSDFYTSRFWENRLKLSIEEFGRDQSVRLFFELLEKPGRLIGTTNFTQIARGPFQACYLGFSIDREFEGKGLMREALETAIKYIFEERHIHRLMANHLSENQRSASILKRLGFRTDGTSPDYLFIRGAWRSHVLTSLTNSNWSPRTEDKDLFN